MMFPIPKQNSHPLSADAVHRIPVLMLLPLPRGVYIASDDGGVKGQWIR